MPFNAVVMNFIHYGIGPLAEGILVIPCSTSQAWFPQAMRMLVANPIISTQKGWGCVPAIQSRAKTSTAGEDEPDGLLFIWESFQNQGISKWSTEILVSGWRDGIQKQYKVYLKRWQSFCSTRKINLFTPPSDNPGLCLNKLFDKGKQYSAINTARSAL